jgi:hypothetical protein
MMDKKEELREIVKTQNLYRKYIGAELVKKR